MLNWRFCGVKKTSLRREIGATSRGAVGMGQAWPAVMIWPPGYQPATT